jgi:hypothetical protein
LVVGLVVVVVAMLGAAMAVQGAAAIWGLVLLALRLVVIQHPVKVMLVVRQFQEATLVGQLEVGAEQAV